jgi:hypothetical protein
MADSTRKPEWTDEQVSKLALFDASRDPKEFLSEIKARSQQRRSRSGCTHLQDIGEVFRVIRQTV